MLKRSKQGKPQTVPEMTQITKKDETQEVVWGVWMDSRQYESCAENRLDVTSVVTLSHRNPNWEHTYWQTHRFLVMIKRVNPEKSVSGTTKALSACWFYSLLHPLLTLYPFSHLPDIETWVLMACFQLHTDFQISGMLEMISPWTGPACSATWGVSSGGQSVQFCRDGLCYSQADYLYRGLILYTHLTVTCLI